MMADARLKGYDTDYLMCRGFLRHAYTFTEDDPEIRPDYAPSRTVFRYAKKCVNCELTIYVAVNRITGEQLFRSSHYPEGYIIPVDENGNRVLGMDVRQECAKRMNGKP